MPRDVRTRWAGVYARHRDGCPAPGRRCRCRPGYFAAVYDRRLGRAVKSPHFPSPQAAAAWRSARMAGQGGGASPPPRLLFGDLLDGFIQAAIGGVALNRQGRPYRDRAALNLRESAKHLARLRGVPCDALAAADFVAALDAMAGLSASRRRNVLSTARAALAYGQARGLCVSNPAKEAAMPSPDPLKDFVPPSTHQFRRIVDRLPPVAAAAYALAGYAGARRQELLDVTWNDVHLDRGTIDLGVRRRKTANARRTVPLTSRLLGVLLQVPNVPGAPIVHSPMGTPLSPGSITKPAKRLLGAEYISLQKARHCYASWLLEAGVPLATVSKLMGHASVAITADRYGHLSERALPEVAAVLAAKL